MNIKFLFLNGHLKDEVFVWELIVDVAIVSVSYSTLFEEQKWTVSEGVLWLGKHTWEGGISILPGSLQIVDNRRINPMKISTWRRRNGWGQIVNYTVCIWKPWGNLHLSMKWQSERWQPLHCYQMWRWQKYEGWSLARNPNNSCLILTLIGPSISSHTLCINITIWW